VNPAAAFRGIVAAAAVFCGIHATGWAGVDLNGNGLDDVWEELQGPLGPPDGDDDGDSRTNKAESEAATDSRDPNSYFDSSISYEGDSILIKWLTTPGKAYRVMESTDLQPNSWQVLRDYELATGLEDELSIVASGTTPRYFRIEVKNVDSDGDGVPDWDELQLPGFDPAVAQSAQAGTSDLVTLSAMLGGGAGTNAISVTALAPSPLEKEALSGVFRLTRSGGLRATTVQFSLRGDANAQRGSASPGDYTMEDTAGNPVTGSVSFPFGVMSTDVVVRPVADLLVETPETLSLTLLANPSYTITSGTGALAITDGANTPANERLLVAYLRPAGAGSTASGLSTIRLQGDNLTALVSLNFSGLTTPQTTSFLALGNAGAGVYVKGLPAGQVTNTTWNVRAAGYLTTDQAMLDALLAGNISAVVNTTGFLEGEIEGNFVAATGSIDPPVPGAPPPIETLTGEALKRDVARFLTQATFGPTEADIAALTTSIETTHGGNRIAGYGAWIDAQLARDQTTLEAYTFYADEQEWALRGTSAANYVSGAEPLSYNRRRAWWIVSTQALDQLRQRIAFALSEILVVSEKNTEVYNRHYSAARFYDQLGAHADGNFRSLLEVVSKSPIMGTYLSHLKNQKAVIDPVTGLALVSPDENYAREIMQLFSIGLTALHPDGSLKLSQAGVPIPTYTNTDITELARVFTGWSFSKRHGSAPGYVIQDNTNFFQSAGNRYFQASWLNPMKNFPTYHDTGAKVVLGSAIPAGLDGEADLDAALDILFAHPNVGPFISRLLIQRLVTSNPSPGYIYRVAQKFADDGTGVRGNIGAMVRTILLDPEARNLSIANSVSYGKQKEPMVRYVQILRAFAAASSLPLSDLSAVGYPAEQLNNFPTGATRMRYQVTDTNLGQTAQGAPTVFNWFSPDYSPGGAIAAAGLVAPEMEITNETLVAQAINYNYTVLNTTSGQSTSTLFGSATTLDDVRISRVPWEAYYQSEITAGKTVTEAVTSVVDRLDLLLMSGRFKLKYAGAPLPNPRSSTISAAVNATTTSDRIINIVYLLCNSPEFLHQK